MKILSENQWSSQNSLAANVLRLHCQCIKSHGIGLLVKIDLFYSLRSFQYILILESFIKWDRRSWKNDQNVVKMSKIDLVSAWCIKDNCSLGSVGAKEYELQKHRYTHTRIGFSQILNAYKRRRIQTVVKNSIFYRFWFRTLFDK